MSQQNTRRRGRPAALNPKDVQLNLRIDQEMGDAIEQYRVQFQLPALSDAVRHALRIELRKQFLIDTGHMSPRFLKFMRDGIKVAPTLDQASYEELRKAVRDAEGALRVKKRSPAKPGKSKGK